MRQGPIRRERGLATPRHRGWSESDCGKITSAGPQFPAQALNGNRQPAASGEELSQFLALLADGAVTRDPFAPGTAAPIQTPKDEILAICARMSARTVKKGAERIAEVVAGM